MGSFKIFGREPALFIGFITAVAAFLGATGIPGFDAGQAAAVAAVLGALVTAFTTKPVAVSLFTGAFSMAVALLAEYSFHLSDAVVGGATALIVAAFALFVVRPQVDPVPSPVNTN